MRLPSLVRVGAGPLAAGLGLAVSIGLVACKSIPLKDGHYSCDPGVNGSCPSGMTCRWSSEAGEYRCSSGPPGDAYVPVCGNGAIDPGEQCDGQSLGGQTCEGLGHPGGTLACSDICAYDRSGCDPPVTCGDGDLDPPGEQCDGSDLGGATCESLGYAEGTLGCLGNCTYDVTQCTPIVPPVITGIDGTGDASAIAPRPEDQAAYDNTPNKVDANRRVDGQNRELVITGTNLHNATGVTAEGQAGQGVITFEIQPGGTETSLTVRFPQTMVVNSGGLFALTVVTDHGQGQAQVYFMQGPDGLDGACGSVTSGDLTVTGKLTVQGGFELGDCPNGYERDPLADPGIVLCVHPPSGDEMVRVGDFWVDRYEATVFDNSDCTGTPLGSTADDWAARAPGFVRNGNWSTKAYACSVPGHIPSGWLTWFQAQAACAAAGKRLCTGEQWQAASQGTFDPGAHDGSAGGACNTQAAGPRVAGNAGTLPGDTTSCISRWGAEDMIGNLWEWVATWHGHIGWNGLYNYFSAEYGDDVYVAGGHRYTHNPALGTGGSWRTESGSMVTGGGDAIGEYYGPAALIRGGSWVNGVRAGVFALSYTHGPGDRFAESGARCCREK